MPGGAAVVSEGGVPPVVDRSYNKTDQHKQHGLKIWVSLVSLEQEKTFISSEFYNLHLLKINSVTS